MALALAGCGASRHVPTVYSLPTPTEPSVDAGYTDSGVLMDLGPPAVRADAGVRSGEIAWLVTHIADDPEPARGGESDEVRRLAAIGADGIHATAEVFRVGDPRRVPFARRVIERVATAQCHRNLTLAGITIVHLQSGPDAGAPPPDAGIIWSGGDDTRWPDEAIARLHHWADTGLPCEGQDAGAP